MTKRENQPILVLSGILLIIFAIICYHYIVKPEADRMKKEAEIDRPS